MKRKDLLFIFLLILTTLIIPKEAFGASNTTYRALLIGNGNYGPYNSLTGPYNDVVKVESTLKNSFFGVDNTSFSSIAKRTDLTKNEMTRSINETFKDTKEGDISYIYFSGHGALDYNNVSYIVGTDGVGLSVHDLEFELRNIPGTIVIILDSCHSGGFINKGLQTKSTGNVSDDYIEDFNQSVINIFSQKKTRSYLVDNKYKVLTASSKFETSVEIGYMDGWGWGGEFTRAFVTGNGYNKKFNADSDFNGETTLDELYYYTDSRMNHSNVQVWPSSDTFIIGSDFGHEGVGESTTWSLFKDIDLNKTWNIKFNMALDNDSWKDNIYMLDSNNSRFPINVSKKADGKNLTVIPLKNYNYNSKYTLIVDDNIYSNSGSKLINKVYIPFITKERAINHDDFCLRMVQDGHFFSHPYPSVRTAFDNFFGYPSWEYFYSTDGRDIVEFNGGAYKGNVLGIVTIQFTVDVGNESFEVNYAAFNSMPMYNIEFDGLLNTVYDYYLNYRDVTDIEDIFIEDPDSYLLDDYLEE